MKPVIAMAGIAEGAAAVGLCVGFVTYLFVAMLALIGIALPKSLGSRIAIMIAVIIVLADAWMFEPWQAFNPSTSDDPDAISLMESARFLGFIWLLTLAILIAAIVRTTLSPRSVNSNPVAN